MITIGLIDINIEGKCRVCNWIWGSTENCTYMEDENVREIWLKEQLCPHCNSQDPDVVRVRS